MHFDQGTSPLLKTAEKFVAACGAIPPKSVVSGESQPSTLANSSALEVADFLAHYLIQPGTGLLASQHPPSQHLPDREIASSAVNPLLALLQPRLCPMRKDFAVDKLGGGLFWWSSRDPRTSCPECKSDFL